MGADAWLPADFLNEPPLPRCAAKSFRLNQIC